LRRRWAVEELPFPVERIQTNRSRAFFAIRVQEKLMEHGIKFRPIKPRSPHLNGNVERSERTDMKEFYSTVRLDDPSLTAKLEERQFHYNWHRPHGALHGEAPIDRCCELSPRTPLWEEAEVLYDPSGERIQEQSCRRDLELRKLKRSL
jgi:transposase InsO family protein